MKKIVIKNLKNVVIVDFFHNLKFLRFQRKFNLFLLNFFTIKLGEFTALEFTIFFASEFAINPIQFVVQ